MSVVQIDLDDPRYQEERELRNRVLLRPIGIPDYGWEKRDPESLHFVATDLKGAVVGCVLLWLPQGKDEAQLLQMAVEPAFQGQGVGRLMMAALLQAARDRRRRRIWCHARIGVVPFYHKLGFQPLGETFQEVGLDHQVMELYLTQDCDTGDSPAEFEAQRHPPPETEPVESLGIERSHRPDTP